MENIAKLALFGSKSGKIFKRKRDKSAEYSLIIPGSIIVKPPRGKILLGVFPGLIKIFENVSFSIRYFVSYNTIEEY